MWSSKLLTGARTFLSAAPSELRRARLIGRLLSPLDLPANDPLRAERRQFGE